VKKALLFAWVLVGAFCLPLSAVAHSGEFGHGEAKKLVEKGEILPMKVIAEKAEKLKSGKLLEVGLRRGKGGYVYKIEILDAKGVVWELQFNAKTGELVEMEQDED